MDLIIRIIKRILEKSQFIDKTFLTTDPDSLDFDINDSFYIPNPVIHLLKYWKIIEIIVKMIFFCDESWCAQRRVKKGKKDDREIFINKLIKMNKSIIFDIYGMLNSQPIWAQNFLSKVSNSSMGLNLSRGKPIKYYSSDRLAQLMGNGLLTFVDKKTKLDDFFSNKEIIMYKDIYDLSYKLSKYKKDKKQRNLIARNGKKKYFKYFNSSLVADYIIKKTLDIRTKRKFL